MVTLFFVIFLIIFIFSFVRLSKLMHSTPYDPDSVELYCLIVGASLVVSLFLLVWTVSLINTVATGNTIAQKIDMYQEENCAIDENINFIVNGYMDFESTTFRDCRDKDGITLVSLFPELKSDSLMQQQIDIYVNNNKKIKELKEQEIDLSKARWKLYFGR